MAMKAQTTNVPRRQGEKITLPPAPSGASRRRRVAFLTGVTILAVTASLVLANIVSDRFHARYDVTSSGNQRLAPRTEQLLSRINQPYRVVIAADFKTVEARSRERVKDVLAEMKRASRHLDYTLIDTGSVAGLEEYKK